MSEDTKIKIVEDLLNINPREMTYEQLKSMQNGWWETLNLLSEQNKENKQLQNQLQQKENIIKEVREYVKNENIDVCTIRYNDIQDVKQELLEILDKVDKGE